MKAQVHPSLHLSRRQRQIMDVLYRMKQATAAEVQAHLPDPPSYSAVRAMLVRLEKKGYLRHQEDGLRYVYSATTTHAAARRAALQQFVRTFFEGSLGQMMTALVRNEAWTDEELDSLRSEIERARTARKP